jgi:hypothetical protein
MNTIAPLDKLKELKIAVSWMKRAVSAYEEGIASRKDVSHLAKRAQKKIESYPPKDFEKEHKETVLDLCISLSTIERAEGNFENFYLDSLNDELDRVASILGNGDNE